MKYVIVVVSLIIIVLSLVSQKPDVCKTMYMKRELGFLNKRTALKTYQHPALTSPQIENES